MVFNQVQSSIKHLLYPFKTFKNLSALPLFTIFSRSPFRTIWNFCIENCCTWFMSLFHTNIRSIFIRFYPILQSKLLIFVESNTNIYTDFMSTICTSCMENKLHQIWNQQTNDVAGTWQMHWNNLVHCEVLRFIIPAVKFQSLLMNCKELEPKNYCAVCFNI